MRSLLLLILLIGWSGCQTTKAPAPFLPKSSQAGKLHWKSPVTSLIADAQVEYGGTNSVRLILTKETASPILILTRQENILTVEDRMQKRRWSGDASRIPAALIGWSALLDALLASPHIPDGIHEIHDAGGWSAVYEIKARRLKGINLFSGISTEQYRLVLN